MTNTEEHRDDRCPLCDLGMSQVLTVVSRHRTSAGTVVYARCDCGRLSMWTEAPAPGAGRAEAPGSAVAWRSAEPGAGLGRG